MKYFLSFLFSLFFVLPINAQVKRDYNWLLGGSSGSDGILMNFNDTPVNVAFQEKEMRMEGSNTSMSDAEGNLLFYSNGCFIANANHEIMLNGDSINSGYIEEVHCPIGGSPNIQGVLALPQPGAEDLYYLFNLNLDVVIFEGVSFLQSTVMYYNVIDMTLDNGLGGVTEKHQIAIQDTLGASCVQATRHANGIDWWVVVPESFYDCYYVQLFTEDGLQSPEKYCGGFETTWLSTMDQAVFSPDGSKYARFNAFLGLCIFDFDNSTGVLSNPLCFTFEEETNISGVAISPNSRYLYASVKRHLYQFDLQAPDIEASKILVAEWDGFANPYPTIFYLSALAPDGKIYISGTSSHLNLHIIHKPNCPGLSCEVEQHGLELPVFNFASIPNFPYYGHDYPSIDCDSMVLSVGEVVERKRLRVFPNPSTNYINISTSDTPSGTLVITDMSRTTLISKKLNKNSGVQQLVHNLPSGFYFLNIHYDDGQYFSEKLVVQSN